MLARRAASGKPPLPYVATAHERTLKRTLRNGLETFLHNTVMSPATACAPLPKESEAGVAPRHNRPLQNAKRVYTLSQISRAGLSKRAAKIATGVMGGQTRARVTAAGKAMHVF
jgi:hypothetical protein